MQGGLYTRDYLEIGIAEEAAWKALADADLTALRAQLAPLFAKFAASHKPNEGVTEKDLIYPVLAALGWTDVLVQQQVSARRRDDVPDALLFADAERKAAAGREREPANRYRHGLAVVEAKRWLRPLDRADAQGTPSSQMLRYLRRAEEASDGKLEWGILTNGRQWRLYWQGARSRAEEFFELDLPAVLGVPGFPLDLFDAGIGADHWLRVFVLMFRRASFLPMDGARQSFHVEALRQTRKWEAKVAEGLSEQVFGQVFPDLVKALAKAASGSAGGRPLTEAELEEVRRAALTLLYRLLFVLYAEDRRLLPVDHSGYQAYSLDRQRMEIAERLDRGDVLSDRIDTRYGSLRALFKAIDGGDPALGLPPYNGGLFDAGEHPLLERSGLADAVLARVVDTLSRRTEGERKLRINYRDLSVQQLGSIYERLLEFAVVADPDEVATIQPNIFARKGSGSYYTPDELVRLIVERTIGPLLDERQQAFDSALARLASERRPKAQRLADLSTVDPAASFLTLRVCDPAMGSGHFLVTLVDMLADRTLAAMADAETKAQQAFGLETVYRSPLQERVEAIRARIRERAEEESTMFHMTNDAGRFRTRAELEKEGVYPVEGGRLRKGSREFVPLYEGKMVQAFDHRAASVVVNPDNLNRPAVTETATARQSEDPNWYPRPQFYVADTAVTWPKGLKWAIGFKDVTAPTNMRTMIASIVPGFGVGNTLPLIVPADDKDAEDYRRDSPLWLANLNSVAFDFVARQKVQGQHLNWFIVEQLPVVPQEGYRRMIGKRPAADLVREEVLHLTYTAHDMRSFAEDLDCDSEPFRWDTEDRRHRRARLDAVFFGLYGIGENDAAYILDTFPIVREQDEKAFGKYRTKEMIVAYMRAFASGDTSSRVSV